MTDYFLIHRQPDGTFDHLVPVDAVPVIEDDVVVGYMLRHNAYLEGGPGDGLLMDLRGHTLVWDSPLRPYDPGEYRLTDRRDPNGRHIFKWRPAPSSKPGGPA